jgi:hypothetical protein
VVTLITRFVTETAAWDWDDVPARVLFTRGDIPKISRSRGDLTEEQLGGGARRGLITSR